MAEPGGLAFRRSPPCGMFVGRVTRPLAMLEITRFGNRRVSDIDRTRLAALERRLGAEIPADFIATLTDREPVCEGSVAILLGDRIWDVRTTFRLDDSDKCDQIDYVYNLVGDAIPPMSLPFASDWAGNFYCLMLAGPHAGVVVHWDHERDAEDHTVETLAPSIGNFYARLVPDPRDASA